MTAALYGATVVNYVEVTGLTKDANGRLTGATIKDKVKEINGKKADEFIVRAKGVINATGPFTDSIRKMDDPKVQEIVAPSSGVHVVLPGYYSPSNMGLIDPSTSDGRVIFFLPWQGNTIAGTTDAPTDITQNPIAGEEEINWILSEISGYLAPDISVRRGDVLAAWSGIRPLVRDPKAKRTEGLVRNHLITDVRLGAHDMRWRQVGLHTVRCQSKPSTKPSPNSSCCRPRSHWCRACQARPSSTTWPCTTAPARRTACGSSAPTATPRRCHSTLAAAESCPTRVRRP